MGPSADLWRLQPRSPRLLRHLLHPFPRHFSCKATQACRPVSTMFGPILPPLAVFPNIMPGA